MKRNYTKTAQRFRTENKGWKGYGFLDPEAMARCAAKGLFQGRTPNS